ncbi:ABC transporter substrate-binding protein [Bacillus sonorensis]|uniref:Aminosugar ABC transporter substrate-binding protein n=2 Tax=Bacillus sonorensis TaxID=119858 RepID=M5PBP7_9BACI|nr:MULTISPECIES: ABC transporter substrate-binding protein [Bacillus]TWK79441.1 putative arabinose-binding protein [Bacillus paralicheniformis]ASB90774.1 Putative binding protein [Bacillus sonorensis]EME73165.1 aminosugar ABC transporter substrate-binding protein [Bacillus sonorensis L12]MBG9914165.1 ABC transporter substrate-binding protein [Bacillus sonorensis]MCF7616593.1 ABC transporter substrate-binding protein [Bacillus sonorensis]
MRKKRVFLFSLMVLLFLSAGCSSTGENAEAAKEVKVWDYFTGKQQELYHELVDQYNQSQDRYKVVTEYIPFNEVKKQLSVGAAGAALPDAVFLDNVDNASFAAMGVLEDLTGRIETWGQTDQFYDGPLSSARYDGKYYGVPFASNALALFYNKDLLRAAGLAEPPKTWSELRKAAQKTSKGQTKGFAMSAVKSEESAFQFYPFLLSSGAEFNHLQSEKAVSSLQFLTDLIKDGSMDKEVLNATQDDLARQFAAGRLAMMINGSWNIERLKEAEQLDYGITFIPKDKTFASALGGENIAVVKGKNADGAWDFITWLIDPKRLETLTAETGVFPPRKDILEKSDRWKTDQHVKAFIPIMDIASARGPSKDWPKMSEALQTALQEALSESKPPEDALKDAARKIKTLH